MVRKIKPYILCLLTHHRNCTHSLPRMSYVISIGPKRHTKDIIETLITTQGLSDQRYTTYGIYCTLLIMVLFMTLKLTLFPCTCVPTPLQKKAIQKSNKDIEKEAEEGQNSLLNYSLSHIQYYIICIMCCTEFMKTLLLMEATLRAENEVYMCIIGRKYIQEVIVIALSKVYINCLHPGTLLVYMHSIV